MQTEYLYIFLVRFLWAVSFVWRLLDLQFVQYFTNHLKCGLKWSYLQEPNQFRKEIN